RQGTSGPAGQAQPARSAAWTQPSRPAAWTQPSWPAVLATTVRLWLARHAHRPGRGLRSAWLTALILAVAAAVGLAVARQDLVGASSGSQLRAGAHGACGPGAGPGVGAGG